MNFSYFGTGSDVSRPDEGLYYVNNENMPTGLQISGISVGTKRGTDFLVPVETTSILNLVTGHPASALPIHIGGKTLIIRK